MVFRKRPPALPSNSSPKDYLPQSYKKLPPRIALISKLLRQFHLAKSLMLSGQKPPDKPRHFLLPPINPEMPFTENIGLQRED